MQTALILMTILGCDDSVTSCHYIDTAKPKWETVALCDAASEKQLKHYMNANYPVVVAVCDKPEANEAEIPAKSGETTVTNLPKLPAPDATTTTAVAPVVPPRPGLARRAMLRVVSILPSVDGMKTLIEKPVHFVTDGYSWVAQRVQP